MLSYETVGYMVILPVICLIGIAGNIITLVVLVKERIQGIAYSYLKAIAVLDLLSLFFILPLVTRCSKCVLRDSCFGPVFEGYIHVFVGDVFIKSSIWTVVIFTAERCVTSCFPTSSLSLLVQKRIWGGRVSGAGVGTSSQRRSAATSVVLIVFISAIENSPTFWNYKVKDNNLVVRSVALQQSSFFRFYIWFDAVFSCLIPTVLLIILNAILIRLLRKRMSQARNTTPVTATTESGLYPHQENNRTSRQQPIAAKRRSRREQTRILVTLTGIVILFLSTILPIFAIQLLGQNSTFSGSTFLNLRVTNSILLAINCSGNFILYCMLNRRFWASFKRVFIIDRCCNTSCTGQRSTTVVTQVIALQQPVVRLSTASTVP